MQSINPEYKLWHAEHNSKWRETAYFHWNGVESSGKDCLAPVLGVGVDKAGAPRLSTPPVGFSWHLVRRGTGEKLSGANTSLGHRQTGRVGLFLWNSSLLKRHQMSQRLHKYGHSFLKTRNTFLMGKSDGMDLIPFSKHATTKTNQPLKLLFRTPPPPSEV